MMNQSKFEAIKAASLGYTEEEYRTSYPQLTEEQISILTKGEANEPSTESVSSTTNTKQRARTTSWRRFR